MALSNSQQHRGCPPQREVWVFGMCDVSQTPALGVIIELLQHSFQSCSNISGVGRPFTVTNGQLTVKFNSCHQLWHTTPSTTLSILWTPLQEYTLGM